MAATALFLYVVVIAYLAARGVEPRRIARIVLYALLAGVIAAYTLGFVYFMIVLLRPVETISVFAIAMLFISAAIYAREEILGTITPAGIVLLNVAANVSPADGPLPLSMLWLATLIPVPYGPVRVALNLLVLYWPAVVALLLLRRGPPGAPLLRFALGAWVCYVGIAAVTSPGWQVVSNFRVDEPARWFAAGFAAYAGVHLVMLALNLIAAIDDKVAARSLARSVRVDRMRPWHALAAGAAFWLACVLFLRWLSIAPELQATAIIAAAFGLGTLLAPRAEADRDDGVEHSGVLPWAGVAFLYVAIFGGFAFWAWLDTRPSRPAATQLRLDPSTGTQVEVRQVPGALLRYPEADLHSLLKQSLAKEGVPFEVAKIRGNEYLRVAEEHKPAMQRAIAAIEGPALPNGRAMPFEGQPRQREFVEWLTRKSVKWEMVKKRRDTYVVWEPGPRHDRLYNAFDESYRRAWMGIDYHALFVIAPGEGDPAIDLARAAAFESPAQREPFVEWLGKRRVATQIVARAGRQFVVWESPEADLLQQYVGHMVDKCLAEYRALSERSAPAIVRNPC
jgi:hypothetical protein